MKAFNGKGRAMYYGPKPLKEQFRLLAEAQIHAGATLLGLSQEEAREAVRLVLQLKVAQQARQAMANGEG